MATTKLVTANYANGGANIAQGPGSANVNAEDVLDMIVDISPHETAVVALLPKVKASSTRHEWVTDALPAANHFSNVQEGADYALTTGASTDSARVRQKNYLQHFRRPVQVTNLQRVMNPFGVADEYSYQVGRAAKALACDLELRILKDTVISNTASIQGTDTDPTRMKTLIELICEENTGSIATTIENVRSSIAHEALVTSSSIWDGTTGFASAAQITEGKVTRMMEQILGTDTSGGGVPDTMIVSPAVFGHIGAFGSSFTNAGGYPQLAAQTFNNDPALKRIIRAVRFYESQFGVLQVVMSRFCPQAANTGSGTTFTRTTAGMAYFVERNRFRIAFARPFQHVPLPPNGDSTRGMVLGDATIELLDSRSAGCLAGVNNVAA